MGPSGAGKSSLLHILGMHDAGWSGEYDFLDQPVHRLNTKQRAELHKQYIGFVFQSYHLLDDLTVYENLEIPLSYRNVARKERQSIVADVLDRFQIVGKKDLYPEPALRRTAATGRHRARGGRESAADACRRADRQSALGAGQRDHGAVPQAECEGTTIVQVTHSEVNASYGSRIIHLRDGWIVDD